MSIISERIDGTIISVDINSSNLLSAIYDTTSKILKVTFKNGYKYTYEDVPWEIFTKFRIAQSQGKYFSEHIAKKYKYTKDG